MINRILMELFDDYEKKGIEALKEFTEKTFPLDGTDKLFIGCMLIMFSRTNSFKGRYSCTRENLLDIVKASKEKVNNTNLLSIYVKKVNTTKGVSKYLNEIIDNPELDKYADVIIDYLEQFKPRFISDLKEKWSE